MSTVRDAENPGTHYVYRCYGESDLLLYVGCTEDVAGRMYHHLALCNRGKIPNSLLHRYMVRHTVTAFPSRLAARAAERAAIVGGAPLLNRQHNPTRFRKGKGGTFTLVAPVHPLTEEAFADVLRRSA